MSALGLCPSCGEPCEGNSCQLLAEARSEAELRQNWWRGGCAAPSLPWEREPAEDASKGRYTTPAETGPCCDAHGVERPPNPATETTWVSSEPPPSVVAPHVADQTPPKFVAMATREELEALERRFNDLMAADAAAGTDDRREFDALRDLALALADELAILIHENRHILVGTMPDAIARSDDIYDRAKKVRQS